jgi:hypothetical protein
LGKHTFWWLSDFSAFIRKIHPVFGDVIGLVSLTFSSTENKSVGVWNDALLFRRHDHEKALFELRRVFSFNSAESVAPTKSSIRGFGCLLDQRPEDLPGRNA